MNNDERMQYLQKLANEEQKTSNTNPHSEEYMGAVKDLVEAGFIGSDIERMLRPIGDTRYNAPKLPPKAEEYMVEDVISTNTIYNRAKETILKAQRKQVAYGLDKYPEPLTASTWSMVEAIDHIIDEDVDKLHYLCMLREKLVLEAEVYEQKNSSNKATKE